MPEKSSCAHGLLYGVRTGQTLSSIAEIFDVTVKKIVEANPGIEPERLKTGQIICIPGVADTICKDGILRTVRYGDTLYLISRQTGVPLDVLRNANPWIKNPSLIYAGEQICIPSLKMRFVSSCPSGLLYAARQGETLFTIGQRFGVTVNQLIAANPGIDPNNLQIGQVICIPGVAARLCPGGTLRTIRKNDTLFKISKEVGIPLNTLIAANPWIPNPNLIYPGEQICIPAAPQPTTCQGGLFYAVRQGETLFTIGQRFGVTVNQLIAANPGIDPNNLQIGQVICIPGVAARLCPGGTLRTIRKNDTLFKISKEVGIPLNTLIAANPWIPNPNLIYPGEQICIPGVQPPACVGGLLYGVRQGETLFTIGQKFGVTVNQLIAANPGIDPNNLQIGQIICIPGVAAELCPNGTLYTVQRNDTMFSIARQFGIPLNTLIAANPWIPNPNVIYPGEQICIPGVQPPACVGGLLYGVRQGETLFTIGQKFGVTVNQLIAANPGIDPNNLQIGQIICIPGVAAELCPNGMLYTVQRNDTMFSIARQFGIPLNTLIAANPWIPNPNVIFPGEQLCIPGRESTQSEEPEKEDDES